MKYINNIPVFLANVDSESAEITCISLVDMPAMELSMQCFDKEEVYKFSIQEEQHNIVSCIVRCDYPIIRVNAAGEPYYILFNKETSKKLCQRLMRDGYQQNISLDHNGTLIEGIQLQEIFIKDSGRGISPIGFEDAAEGSLFGVWHITDEELWKKCLEGKFGGVSMESMLNIQEFKQEKIETEENIITNKKMTKMAKLKQIIENLLLKFAEVESDKGLLEWAGDKQLEVGDEVYLNGEPAPDGDYKVGDKIFVIVEGKVAEIKEEIAEDIKPASEDPIELEAGCKKKKMEEEIVEEIIEEPAPEIKEEIIEEIIDEKEERIKALEDKVAALEIKIEELLAKINIPAEKPIEEQKPSEEEIKMNAEEEMLERLRRLRKN